MGPRNSPEPILLYVDDEWANRVVFEQSFNDIFKLKTVASGKEALEVLRSEPVAVLVSDQRMPEMDGTELLRLAKESHPDTVRMIITAYSDLEPILRAVNDGLVARYVVKPWSHEELERILTWGLEAYRMGQEDSKVQARLFETERLAAIGSIAAAVLHDLNNPITFFGYTADHLVDDLAPRVPELKTLVDRHLSSKELSEMVGELPQIGLEMKDATRLSRDILSTLRRMVRPVEARPETIPAEPGAAIRFAMTMSKSVIAEASARLIYDGPAQLPRVRLGHTELIQVLLNLISNAAQALERTDSSQRRVVVSAADADGEVRISVSDNGPGMSAEVLAKIGTPFFSLREGGTGLGVNQVRRLISSVEGKLTISSTLGKGSDFSFTLPKA